MSRFFDWWGARIRHIFTGERRYDRALSQRVITSLCILAWGVGMLSIWVFVMLLIFTKRLKVKGRVNVLSIPPQNLLTCANHGSVLGPGIVPMVWRMPRMLFNPRKYNVWQTPRKNIINTPFMQLGKLSPIIPVNFDQSGASSDHIALRAILLGIKQHTFLIFPEGTRSYHASPPHRRTKSGVLLGSPFRGVGYIVYRARPTVVPILIKNEEYFFPPTKSLLVGIVTDVIPKIINIFGPSIEVTFGSPISFSDVPPYNPKVKKGELQRVCADISARIMSEIAALDR